MRMKGLSLVGFYICMLVTLAERSPANRTACPDWCKDDLEPRSNDIYRPYPFEASQLLATCDVPTLGDITISWNVPLEHSDNVTGYRVLLYAGKLYCECLDKDSRKFVITNGTKGWHYPRSLAFMVKPLPRPDPNETFVLDAVNCLENNDVTLDVQSEHLETETGSTEAKYLVVSLGIAVGVLLCLTFVIMWKKIRGNKQLDYEDQRENVPDLREQHLANENSVYVSYYSYNQAFTELVHEISCWLIEQGIFTIMDRMFTCEISDIGMIDWSERHMAKAKKVLIMCSKPFLEMCKLRELMQIHKGVVGTNLTTEQLKILKEIAYIKRDMFLSGHCSNRFIAVLIGVKEDDLPPWLREFQICSWPQEKEKIIKFVNDEEYEDPEKIVV